MKPEYCWVDEMMPLWPPIWIVSSGAVEIAGEVYGRPGDIIRVRNLEDYIVVKAPPQKWYPIEDEL